MGIDPELKKILISIQSRLEKIEKEILLEKPRSDSKEKKYDTKKKKYDRLSGGIRLLIDSGFFNEPREMREIINELKREGYHYPDNSTFKILSVDFLKKQKILSRLKEGRNYKYAIRK